MSRFDAKYFQRLLKRLYNTGIRLKLKKLLKVFLSPAYFYRTEAKSTACAKEILNLQEQLDFARENCDKIRGHSKPIKVLLLINTAGTLNCFKEVYELMLSDSDFLPSIIAVPLYKENNELDAYTYKQLISSLAEQNISYTEGISEDLKTPLDLLSLSPDYVFYLDPYMQTYAKHQRADFMSLFARVCYIPYGYMMLDNLNNSSDTGYYNRYFHNLCWRIFCESPWHLEQFKKYQRKAGRNVLYLGYPKNASIAFNCVTDSYWKKIKQNFKKIIIWAPHWTISDIYSNCKSGNFDRYCKDMLDMAKRTRDVFFALRPHPNLRNGVISTGFMSGAEFDEYISVWNSNHNAACYIGNDYQQMFSVCDALILDSISFIAEFVPYNKPGLYLERRDRTKLNEFGNRMLERYEKAYDFRDIERFVDEVTLEDDVSCNKITDGHLLNNDAVANICNYLKQQ
ncbi:MAG: hypothetical protein LBI30_03040 [Holosporales bacterium]|jgi:hypothetical protein|nr:hypothetical protein [Holosporales bacterium]